MPGLNLRLGLGLHGSGSGAGASASEQLLAESDAWLTPRVNDGDNTYREDTGSFFLSEAADHSGNGRTFSQATAAQQFVREDAELNGNPVWGPDASDRNLLADVAAQDIPRDLAVLTVGGVIEVPDVTDTRSFFMCRFSDAGFWTDFRMDGGSIGVSGRRLPADTFEEVLVSRTGLTGWGFWIVEFDWGQDRARAWRNNTQVIDGEWLNNASSGQNSDDQSATIGIYSIDQELRFVRRQLAEMFVFRGRRLTAQEKTDLWEGLGQGEWGLS